MGCGEYREALSARLDGEDRPHERARVDAHMHGCAGCRRWLDDAATVTRLAGTGLVTGAQPVSDVVLDELLDAAPQPRDGGRLAVALRTALGVLGALQLVLGLAQTSGFSASAMQHVGAAPNHLWHESAAWNVAIGAGFVWIALRRTRPTGIVPTLTAFVAVLSVLSVNDLILDRVDVGRLLSHGFVVAGYLIVLVLSHRAIDRGEPPAGRRHGETRWRVRFDDDPPVTPPKLRLLSGLSAENRARDRHAA